jgi:maltooligosyltrehalose trehalohydrolase
MKEIAANYINKEVCVFRVWAPEKDRMILHIIHPHDRKLEMQKDKDGYFFIELKDIPAGTRYFLMPEGKNDLPDPGSRFQPEGVHGPSEVIDHAAFAWEDDAWRGLPFGDLVLYELHVGTFTPEGTFEAIIPLLDDLVDVGINAIELMPVAQFPGTRNWGYDGVFPYAVQNSYGGPEGLKRLVNACHKKGIAVFLDVVYNHLGPEGNYFEQFGPYFTDQYKTPWGKAINFDGKWSDGVREYFSNNPLYWFGHYHIDGLRLDAIHTIFDSGAVHLWELTHEKIRRFQQQTGRHLYMTAECDLNSPRMVQPVECGGYAFDAQWLDDFHHALYVLLDRKGAERYADFGKMEQLAKAYKDGFVHSGEYVKFRKRNHGRSSAGIPGDKFVVFNMNHDQVGNRVFGERLSVLVDFERLKLAAAALLLSPYIPMLFMGEEYGENAPFFYFVSHSDPKLIKAVQEGRKKEFESFQWQVDPPDPQDERTFGDSKINWNMRTTGKHHILLKWHRELLQLRKAFPLLRDYNKNNLNVDILEQKGFVLKRQNPDGNQFLYCLFNISETYLTYQMPSWSGLWRKILDSKESPWMENTALQQALPLKIHGNDELKLPPLSISIYMEEK